MVSTNATYGRCALCEQVRPGLVEGVCPACAQWAQAVDRLANMPPDHAGWQRLLRDLEDNR